MITDSVIRSLLFWSTKLADKLFTGDSISPSPFSLCGLGDTGGLVPEGLLGLFTGEEAGGGGAGPFFDFCSRSLVCNSVSEAGGLSSAMDGGIDCEIFGFCGAGVEEVTKEFL